MTTKEQLERISESIELEIAAKWESKHCKWFFPKRRKIMVKYLVYRKYEPQIFAILDNHINTEVDKAIHSYFEEVWNG